MEQNTFTATASTYGETPYSESTREQADLMREQADSRREQAQSRRGHSKSTKQPTESTRQPTESTRQPIESTRQPSVSTRATATRNKKKKNSHASASASVSISFSISEANVNANTSTTASVRGYADASASGVTPLTPAHLASPSGVTPPTIAHASSRAQSGSQMKKSKPTRSSKRGPRYCVADLDGRMYNVSGERSSPLSQSKYEGKRPVTSTSLQCQANKKFKTKMQGLRLYTNLDTGPQILNPGMPSQKLISTGNKKKKAQKESVDQMQATPATQGSQSATSKGKKDLIAAVLFDSCLMTELVKVYGC